MLVASGCGQSNHQCLLRGCTAMVVIQLNSYFRFTKGRMSGMQI